MQLPFVVVARAPAPMGRHYWHQPQFPSFAEGDRQLRLVDMPRNTASGDQQGFTATKGANSAQMRAKYFALAKPGQGETTVWKVKRDGKPMCIRKGRPIFVTGDNCAFRKQACLSGLRAKYLPNTMWLKQHPKDPEKACEFNCTLCMRPMGNKAPWFVPKSKTMYTLTESDDVPASVLADSKKKQVEVYEVFPLPFDSVGCAATWIYLKRAQRQDAVARWFSLLLELVTRSPPPGFDPEEPKPLPTLCLPGEFIASGRTWEEWDKLAWTYEVPTHLWATHVRSVSRADSGFAEIRMSVHYTLEEHYVTDGTGKVVRPVVVAEPVTSDAHRDAVLEEQRIAEGTRQLLLALGGKQPGLVSPPDVSGSGKEATVQTRMLVPSSKRFNPHEVVSLTEELPEAPKELLMRDKDGTLRSADGRAVTQKEIEVRERATAEERDTEMKELSSHLKVFEEDLQKLGESSKNVALARDQHKKVVRQREKTKVEPRNRQVCGRRKKTDSVIPDLLGEAVAEEDVEMMGGGGGEVAAPAPSKKCKTKKAQEPELPPLPPIPSHALHQFLLRKFMSWPLAEGEDITIVPPEINEANVRMLYPDIDLSRVLVMHVAQSSKEKGGAKILVQMQGMACKVPCMKVPQYFTKKCMRLQDRAVAVLHHVLSCFTEHPDQGEDVMPPIDFTSIVMDHPATVKDIVGRAPSWRAKGWTNNKGTKIPQADHWESIMQCLETRGIQLQALNI